MKHTSPTGKFLREHITKGKLLKSTLASTISSLGLFGSLALFKELEKAIDPEDTSSLSVIKALIDQVNVKIKNQHPGEAEPVVPVESKDPSLDFMWIWIGLPYRGRKIIYFNPPYTKSVETDIGKKFLNLVKECFPKDNVLNKIFNKNNIKVTYSCLPSMGARISGSNKYKLKENKEEVIKKCVCRKEVCPVKGECNKVDTIYEAVITDSFDRKFKYIGKSSTEFIKRYRNHKKAIKKQKIYKKL